MNKNAQKLKIRYIHMVKQGLTHLDWAKYSQEKIALEQNIPDAIVSALPFPGTDMLHIQNATCLIM